MKTRNFRAAEKAGALVGVALLALLTGCVVDGGSQRRSYRTGPQVSVQATAVVQDDFDYYPGYEIYYSRSRQEYVYRDGRRWVRAPAPRSGLSVELLFASPVVRMDFHDEPSRHHRTVVRRYPRSWSPPVQRHDTDSRRDNWNEKKSDREERAERK